MRQTLRIVVLFALALGLTAQSRAQSPDVTLTGTLQGANGLPARNTVLTFTPSQTFYIVGTGTVAAGVTSIIPGTNITCTPLVSGHCVGDVTINATGGGGSGCISQGDLTFQISDGSGGCLTTPATYGFVDPAHGIDHSFTFTFSPPRDFIVAWNNAVPDTGGGHPSFLVSAFQLIGGLGNTATISLDAVTGEVVNKGLGGLDLVNDETISLTSHGVNIENQSNGGALTMISQGGGTVTLSGDAAVDFFGVTGFIEFDNTVTHNNGEDDFINAVGLFSASTGGGGILDQSAMLSGDNFDWNLARLSGTFMMYTGSLTPNHCVEVNSTGDGFIDAGATCGTGGSGSAFNAITSGSNTSATMVVGSGASLNFTGTGTIGATSVGGITVTGTPSTGQALIATSSSAADWQTIGSSFITSLTTTGSSGAATVSGGVLNIPNYATGGSSAFSALTTSTNTTATMTCGTGCAITISGSGTNSATAVGGIVVTGTPSIGQVLTATSTSAANWQSPAGGSSAFSALTSSTNTTAAMIVGSGASLTFSGSGTINASTLGGVALSGLCQTGGTGCPTLASTKSAVSNQFLNSYNSGTGVFTSAQPSFSNISGQAALTQLPTLSANQVLGALTATTPSGLTMPSCSTGTSALTWTTGTGFGCNSISGTSWSTISNPSGSLSLSMAANTSTFTFNASTGSADLMNFTDTTSNTGTGILAHFHTQPSSTEIPWQADANGCGWKVDATGALVSTCTGTGIAILGEGAGPSGIASTDIIYGDSTAHRAKMINNNGTATNIAGALFGTTGTITGTSLSASCDSGTVSVTGAVVGQDVAVSSTTGADVGGAFNLRASVTSTNTVTVFVCGTGTPSSLAYNVAVLQ